MPDFIEAIASDTAFPSGSSPTVGDSAVLEDRAWSMVSGTRGVDFTTDWRRKEAPGSLVFTDHVALLLQLGFSRVQKICTEPGLHQRIVFIGSGKLGFPEAAVFAFALGSDAINVGRAAMLEIGCIQRHSVTRIIAPVRRTGP
jgi:hypothetical protein